MSDSTNICLACGLCCDGTLIGFVALSPDEIPRIKDIMEIEIEHDNGFFLHPCDKYCNGCTVYNDRPKNCAKFKCGLLNSVEEKEITFETAVEAIDFVKQKKHDIQEKLMTLQVELKSDSIYFKMVELKKVLKKLKATSTLTQNHLELILDLEQLDDLLAKKFGITLD